MLPTTSFFSIKDVNDEIIKNLDFDDIISLLDVDPNLRRVITISFEKIFTSYLDKLKKERLDSYQRIYKLIPGTEKLIKMNELKLAKMIIDFIYTSGEYGYYVNFTNFYEQILTDFLTDQKSFENSLKLAPSNYKWTSIKNNYSNIISRKEQFNFDNPDTQAFEFYLTSALNVKSIPLLTIITRHYDENQGYHAALSKFITQIGKAKLIIGFNDAIKSWDNYRENLDIDTINKIDNLIDHLELFWVEQL